MERIEIQTTQNVTIEYQLATLQDRFLAMLIDSLIVFALYLVVLFLTFSVLGVVLEEDNSVMWVVGFFPIVGFLGYHLISEIVANGQSWGKKALGLKVVRMDGAEAGLSDYLLRSIFHIVDTLFSIGILAALLISSSQRKQRLGDMTANTTVIKLKVSNVFGLEEILRINTLDGYEPTYPGVRHFQESDMLLIKQLIGRFRKYPNTAHEEAVELAADRFADLLDMDQRPADAVAFLQAILKDYVVLTR